MPLDADVKEMFGSPVEGEESNEASAPAVQGDGDDATSTTEQAQDEPEQTSEPAEKPEDKAARLFKFQGREMDRESVVSQLSAMDDEELQDLLITRGKHNQLQKKHLELLEQLRAQGTADHKPAAENAEHEKPMTIEELRTSVKPVLEDLVKSGRFSSEFIETWPDEAAGAAWIYQEVLAQKAFREQMEFSFHAAQQQRALSAFNAAVERQLDAMAASGDEFFGALADRTTRDQFLTQFGESSIGQSVPIFSLKSEKEIRDLLETAWTHLHRASIVAAAKEKASAVKKTKSETARAAVGQPSGAGGAPSRKSHLFDDVAEMFSGARDARG